MLFDLLFVMAFGTLPIGLAAVAVFVWESFVNWKERSK